MLIATARLDRSPVSACHVKWAAGMRSGTERSRTRMHRPIQVPSLPERESRPQSRAQALAGKVSESGTAAPR